jgi:hypothetical protein
MYATWVPHDVTEGARDRMSVDNPFCPVPAGPDRWDLLVMSYVPGVSLNSRCSKNAGQTGSRVPPIAPDRTGTGGRLSNSATLAR